MRTGLAAAGFSSQTLEGEVLNGRGAHRMPTRGAGVCGEAVCAALASDRVEPAGETVLAEGVPAVG